MPNTNDTSTCIIFNPTAGRSRARHKIEAIRRQVGPRVTWMPTKCVGDARSLARRAADEGFGVIAAAGGDGTVHEVANGILKSGRTDCAMAVIPIGSANDFAFSLEHQTAKIELIDVGLVQASGGTEEYFVCCLGIGLSGCVTAESRCIPRLQGEWLYGLATLVAVYRHWNELELSLSFDGGLFQHESILMLSVMNGQREGGLLISPDAEIGDGLLDCVLTRPMSRIELFRLFSQVARHGLPRSHSKLVANRHRKIQIKSKRPIPIHVDGELIQDNKVAIYEATVSILPRRLRIQVGLPFALSGN